MQKPVIQYIQQTDYFKNNGAVVAAASHRSDPMVFLIQGRYLAMRVYTPGGKWLPNETIPCTTPWHTMGPPESPWRRERKKIAVQRKRGTESLSGWRKYLLLGQRVRLNPATYWDSLRSPLEAGKGTALKASASGVGR